MASKFPGIPIGEINPTLSRPVLTSSKMHPATFKAKPSQPEDNGVGVRHVIQSGTVHVIRSSS